MNVITTALPDVIVLEPKVFADARGHFFESYNRRALAEHGITADFVRRPPVLSSSLIWSPIPPTPSFP